MPSDRDDGDLLQDEREIERREELATGDGAEKDDAKRSTRNGNGGRISVQEMLRSANEARPLFLEGGDSCGAPGSTSSKSAAAAGRSSSLLMPLLVPMPMQDRESDRCRSLSTIATLAA